MERNEPFYRLLVDFDNCRRTFDIATKFRYDLTKAKASFSVVPVGFSMYKHSARVLYGNSPTGEGMRRNCNRFVR